MADDRRAEIEAGRSVLKLRRLDQSDDRGFTEHSIHDIQGSAPLTLRTFEPLQLTVGQVRAAQIQRDSPCPITPARSSSDCIPAAVLAI